MGYGHFNSWSGALKQIKVDVFLLIERNYLRIME